MGSDPGHGLIMALSLEGGILHYNSKQGQGVWAESKHPAGARMESDSQPWGS